MTDLEKELAQVETIAALWMLLDSMVRVSDAEMALIDARAEQIRKAKDGN